LVQEKSKNVEIKKKTQIELEGPIEEYEKAALKIQNKYRLQKQK
jgi:hypothetical protein